MAAFPRRPTKAEREARQREWDAEQARVAALEALWLAVPESDAKAALKTAMLDEAWRFLDRGETEACDAILLFLPNADVRALLDEYFFDDDENSSQAPPPTISEGKA